MYSDREDIISPEPDQVQYEQVIKSVANTVPQNNFTQPSPAMQEQLTIDPSETIEAAADIPTEILELLGEAKKLDPELGTKIPEEVAERWGKILLDGLAKDQKEILKGKMLVPENFTLARAPKLNPEVASVLSDSAKNRDKHLEAAQNQLGTGIAGLVNLTKDLIQTQSIDKIDILKRISEVSQILLDLHHEETFNRRKLIVPLLDKNFWNIIKGVKRDDLLFGTKLGENIKTSKDIERSSQQIKKPNLPNIMGNRRPGFQQGNARGPPRKMNNTSTTQAPGRHQPQPSTSSTRRTHSTTTQRGRHMRGSRAYDKKNRY